MCRVSFKQSVTVGSSTTLTLFIQTQPNNIYYPSPAAMGALLDSKKSQLKALFSSIDTTQSITTTTFVRLTPAFSVSPSLNGYDYQSVEVSVSLNIQGFIYIVFIKTNNLTVTAPSSFQIWKGLDANNIDAYMTFSTNISVPTVSYVYNISGLEPLTEYYMAITGGSIHPGYPDLMASNAIVSHTFFTPAMPCK